MQHKQILLVVDDVDSLDQLKKLAGNNDWFGRGSRVIITTKDKSLLTVHGVKPTYDVHGLGHQEALELFSSNAVLDIEKLDADEKPKCFPPKCIQDILLISYDGLQDTARNVFLDIACFFKGRNRNEVIQILERCDRITPEHSIKVLEQKALISVGRFGDICMHDLLQEMGKVKVLQESTENMQNLTSLKLRECKFLKQILDMSGSPNLESLDLSFCSSLEEIHPSVGYLEKLVHLNLISCSNLVKLPPEVNWRSLQSIGLEHCRKLESFPEIVGEMKYMTFLSLSYTGIKTLPSSIRYLINLEQFSLTDCRDLTDIPRSIYELQKLKNFELAYCPKLVTFPTNVDSPDSGDYLPGCNSSKIDFLGSTLVDLNLSGWPFVTLPECIKEFFNLSRLTLRGCRRLVEIPELPPRIRELDACDCVSLERISKLSNILERKESQLIKEMNLTNCWRLGQNLLAEMAASKEDDDLFSRLLCSQLSDFTIKFPVPKWVSCHMNFMGREWFALPNFKRDNNTGLALCVAVVYQHVCLVGFTSMK
ncbi:hypothetical protein ACLB2K_016841 [Fragaria x ananassa]